MNYPRPVSGIGEHIHALFREIESGRGHSVPYCALSIENGARLPVEYVGSRDRNLAHVAW